ncbi:class I SAM-dependent methyltransferase [Nanoarchaeota archaeon]
MKRVLEDDSTEDDKWKVYNNLSTLNLVNDYFLKRALELCPKGRVLDVGCGTGRMLNSITGDYDKHGLDIDERVIRYARERDRSTNYQIGDSNDLPYETASFDLVICHSLLHHLPNTGKTIDEMLRVARPEGATFIRDLSRPSNEEVLERFYLGFLAFHYDETNKNLFRKSLKSSFSFEEWKHIFDRKLQTERLFFYNIAERPAKHIQLDIEKRRLEAVEFTLKRLTHSFT